MIRTISRYLCVVLTLLGLNLALTAQANPTGTVTGTITDATHAAIPGATVKVMGILTGIELHTTSGGDGHYSLANVAPGNYIITVAKSGFKTGTYQDVTIAANQTYTLNSQLQVGTQDTTVTVEAGQNVIETQQSSVGTSITGNVITELPSASASSALYSLTQTDPAIQTMGAPRQSSAEGLPGGAINITIDGISAQWESGKSGDPVFTMITPNASDTSEFDVVSAAGSANQTGEGAVQINFTSKRGTDQFHGSVFDYFRNDALNSNYYFNNLAGQPRPVMRYNQWGFSVGGPIWKNKLYFYFDITKFSQPEGQVANATILNADAAKGLFDYPVTGNPDTSTTPWVSCSNGLCKANLLAMAQNYGYNSNIDPFVGGMLTKVAGAAAAPGVTLTTPPSTFQQTLAFPQTGSNAQQNPDFRLDYNINSAHSLEFDYHLSRLIIFPDDLNGGGFSYPVAPYNTNQFGYAANRAIWATAWRWAVNENMNNELRVGFQNSPSSFNFNQTNAIYPTLQTNVGAIRMRPLLPAEMTNPYKNFGPTSEWDNVYQLNDNFAWVRGNHNMSYGVTVSRARFSDQTEGNEVASVGVGLSGNEPVAAQFVNSNFPGISPADLTSAGNIYGLLTGNVTSYSSNVAFDPASRKFVTGAPGVDRYHQTDFGIFGSDSFRLRPNLTVNYGLRWQYEGVPVDDYNEYFIPDGGMAAAYGISGAGNLFKPGTQTGATPTFTNDLGKQWYNNWYKGFAPSLGVAWSPAGGLLGNAGDTVVRAGYSIAYSREGLQNFSSIASNNPGYSGVQFASAAPAQASQPAGQFDAGTIQIGNMNIPGVAQTPAAFQSHIPLDPLSNQNSVRLFDPHLHMPYVESWTFGIQRALGSHTALEIRYVGNHGVGLWQRQNLNEANIFENKFLPEFQAAANNLAICQANASSCTGAGAPSGNSFGDWGLPGQAPLPIMTAAFNPAGATSQGAKGFTNSTFVTDLQRGAAGSMANSIATTYNYWQDMIANGLPSNEFLVNPDARGGSYILHNALASTYNALIIEVRRRPVHGLTLNTSYTYSKSLTDDWQRSGSNFLNSATLRDPGLMKGPAPFDIRNSFKFFSIYDLPFGNGQRWANHSGWINTLAGGWQFDSNLLLQSGRPGLITGGLGGSVNQGDSGVILNGITAQSLQSQLQVYKTTTPAPGAVWYVPQSLLASDGSALPSVIRSCNTPGAECQRLFLYDAPLFLPDLSLVKNTQLTERIGSQIQVQFLNAFNNANFFWTGSSQTFGTASGSVSGRNFGRITNAFQAVDSDSDHGGRTVQIVAKITF